MGGLEVAQSTVLDERDLPAGELEFEHGAVVRRAHQHRLFAQVHPLLPSFQHPVANLGGLGGLIPDEHKLGPHPALALGA